MAVLVSDQNLPPSATRLEWPIRETRAEWDNQATRYRDLPSEITQALEAIQPYRAELPDWNSLGILHNLARIDRHRAPHGLDLCLANLRTGGDANRFEVVDAVGPGVIRDGEQIVRLRLANGLQLSPDNFDLDLEFEVDVSDVRLSLGPSGRVGRPWESLDKRLYFLIRAVGEYSDGLLINRGGPCVA